MGCKAPESRAVMWVLRSRDRREEVVWRLLPGAVKTVGRSRQADFAIDAPLLSRLHCRLTASPADGLTVEDLSSTNGTFVNERRVRTGALAPGDCLRIGRLELTVEWVDSAEDTRRSS